MQLGRLLLLGGGFSLVTACAGISVVSTPGDPCPALRTERRYAELLSSTVGQVQNRFRSP
jgi:hypothetical protein